jgi:osmotically-inducible protein OsmY
MNVQIARHEVLTVAMKVNLLQHPSIRIGALGTLLALGGCATVATCGRKSCEADQAITARVRVLLAQHDSLAAPNLVTVQTIDHVVYLKGLVGTPYQQGLASSVAGQADGVIRVVNLISLENTR